MILLAPLVHLHGIVFCLSSQVALLYYRKNPNRAWQFYGVAGLTALSWLLMRWAIPRGYSQEYRRWYWYVYMGTAFTGLTFTGLWHLGAGLWFRIRRSSRKLGYAAAGVGLFCLFAAYSVSYEAASMRRGAARGSIVRALAGTDAEARPFNSELPLDVVFYHEGKASRHRRIENAGTTPAVWPIFIPEGYLWYVEPTGRVTMPELAAEIESHEIPGVFMPINTEDEDLAHLSDMTHIRWLGLWRGLVSDAGLEHLKDMTEMRILRLGGVKITDAGLEHLKGMTELRELTLWRTSVTAQGVAELQRALPQADIRRSPRIATDCDVSN